MWGIELGNATILELFRITMLNYMFIMHVKFCILYYQT